MRCPLRQTLTLVRTEAGPLEAAGKDVNGVVKSIDAKLAAVGIMMEKGKSHCKGCPAVSFLFKNHFSTNLFSILSVTVRKKRQGNQECLRLDSAKAYFLEPG